jgi:hypothetical protein
MLANLLQAIRYSLHGFALRPMLAVSGTSAIHYFAALKRPESIPSLRCVPSNPSAAWRI